MSGSAAGGAGDPGRGGKTPSRAAPGTSRPCDAIVVGSGFGGAVTACRLAQAGLAVELFERGRRYALSDFPALPKTGELWPEARRWTWIGSNGLWDIRNLDGLSIAQAAGYGGGSLVYANVHLRPPTDVFDHPAWPADCRGRTGLDPYFDLVGHMLDVNPVPAEWRQAGKTGVMAEAFRTATNGVPDNVFFPPLAIKFPAASPALPPPPPPPKPEDELPLNGHGRPQAECQRCGACDFGCRYGAKNTLDRNYLAEAEKKGVQVHTLTEVNLVSPLAGGGYRVHYHDHLLDVDGTIDAPYVFLCGGSVNTTELLLRSIKNGLPFPAPKPDEALEAGQRYFFNADALAMIFDGKQETFASAGPVITTALIHQNPDQLPRHAHATDRPWFLIEDGGYPAAMEHLFSVFRTPLLLGRNRFDPSREPPTALTAIQPPIAPVLPDRYPAFVGGLLAALREGTLPDRLPPTFKAAHAALTDLAKLLRDDEIGELTEAVRDAVFMNSWVFKKLRQSGFDKRWPRVWRWIYRVIVRFVAVDGKQLLATTLDVTHHRYGVDDPRTFPDRVVRAAMGERYPINAPDNPFDRELPKAPPPDGGRRALLLAMGRDDLPATLKLLDDGRLVAQFADASFPTLAEEERVMRGIADALGGTLRANPLWSFARRPISAHSHGGCSLGVVTDDWGEVKGNRNLYINDGALLPRPVGVNPSATIAAVAERNMAHFVREKLHLPALPWQQELDDARVWAKASTAAGVQLEPPRAKAVSLSHQPIGFSFVEDMAGFLMPTDHPSCLPDPRDKAIPQAPFLVAEQQARTGGIRTSFHLRARVQDIGSFLNDKAHPLALEGTIELQKLPNGGVVKHPVRSGTMNLLTDAGPGRRSMTYTLVFESEGRPWTLKGIKEIFDDPGFDAWVDTSMMYAELHEGADTKFHEMKANTRARGILRLGIKDFLQNQLQGLEAEGTTDPARVIWTLGSFGVFFFGQLQGIYAPEIDRFRHLFGTGWRAQRPDVQKATPPTARLLRGL
jgi:choline dehydrogenase-like flavoprotein